MSHSADLHPTGDLAESSLDALLAACATHRFTGVLTIDAHAAEYAFPLRGGAVALDLERSLGEALERARGLRRGAYRLIEALPPLEGASSAHPLRREGRLGPATFADLLRWCDDVALTGTVHLNVGDATPRAHVFRLEAGALVSVELESWDESELSSLFACADARFVVRMTSRFGALTPSMIPGVDEARTRREDLRAVRMGLEALLRHRDAATSGRWRCLPTETPGPVAPAPRLERGREEPEVLVYVLDSHAREPRTAPPGDRTERLDVVRVAGRPSMRRVAMAALGFAAMVAAGFGVAAGFERLGSNAYVTSR